MLIAFQQVEDGLSGLDSLSRAAADPECGRRRRAPRAGHRQRSLCRRRDHLSRCHHRAIRAADQPASVDPIARSANGHLGSAGQSIGRRLGRIADPERAGPSLAGPGRSALNPKAHAESAALGGPAGGWPEPLVKLKAVFTSLQNERSIPIAAANGPNGFRWRDRPIPVFSCSEQSCETCGRIEVRKAKPVDRTLL